MLTHKQVLFVHLCCCGVFLVTSQCHNKQVVHDGSKFLAYQDYEEITATLGHYAELRCCASSFTKINWYKKDGKTWNPIQIVPAHFNPLAPIFIEEGQVLVLKSARKSDQGNYKCVLEKDGKDVDKRTMALTVAECDELARGPYVIAPVPCDITTVTLDGSITLPCNGYFGCGDDDMRTVTWLVTESHGSTQWREASDVSERYRINYSKRNGNSELGAYLTINHIQSEDLNRKFMCLLSTPQVIDGESKLVVQLQSTQRQNRDTAVDSASIYLIFLSVVCAVLVIVLVLIVVGSFMRRNVTRNKNTRRSTNKDTQLSNQSEEKHMFTLPNNVYDV